MAARPVLAVMTRWPSPGCCKRRLAADLQAVDVPQSSQRAAAVQQRLVLHTLAECRVLQQAGHLTLIMAIAGLGPQAVRRWGMACNVDRTHRQHLGNLGCRLRHLLMDLRRSDPKRSVLVIGTDLPTLNRHDLLVAIERLQDHELVLGPATDGGYWLIGLNHRGLADPARWPLDGIPWGSHAVLERTIEQADAAGLATALLPEHRDLDHLSDLSSWLN